MSYTRFSVEAPAEWEDALTMVLYAHGAPGLEVEDPAIIAAHLAAGDWDASVFDGQAVKTGRVILRAIFPGDMPLTSLYRDIASLSAEHGRLFAISATSLPEQDWQRLWRESFPTLCLGQKLVVTPYWRKEAITPGKKALFISPGQAFGTGDHATTALCAELLEKYMRPGCKVADVGCGSGILAIAALKLGAARALAIDNDPLCAASIAEHRAINSLTEVSLPFLEGDILLDAAVQNACRVFAPKLLISNIVADVVAKLALPVSAMLVPGGIWICGGILREKERQVAEALAAARWQVLERRQSGEWLVFCCRGE
ncbi:MAG: 50S ribosomal protein L11 methyltransferase [Clostridiales bacterium]|nr:50S ribosomal protein L11 methyltransferase [Clostridiales bacterium]